MARKRNTGGNAQQRVAASTAKRIPSTRQEIVEDLQNVAAGGKPGGNRINEAYAAYRARKEQEQPERAMDEAVDAWVQWNQARARTPQYRMAQDEAAEREASGYVSPENYAASIQANQRAAGRTRAGGVVMSDGRYHVGKRAQEELDRLAQSTARSELAMRAQEDETAMFRGSDYWLQRANELEQKHKASRSGYGGMMQGGTAFRETPELTAQDRKDWDKAREYYYQVKNAERWGSMPEDLRQKALEAAGYTTDSVLAWQDGDEAALAGMTPDQRAQIQRDQRARRNQIAAILAGAGYEPEEVIEYASRVRNAERMQQEMAGLSEDVTGRGAEGVARGVYGTVQSYATNLLSPIGSVGLLTQKLFRGGAGAEQYRPVDYNTPSMYYSQATSTIRGAVGGQMSDVGRFFYDTVNSAVDSGVRMLVGQALGGGGIKPSPDMADEAAAKLNRFVSGFISTQMSGEVFANSFVQAKESGSTDADALLDSVTSALIEGLTEKYSVESILKNPNGLTWTALRNSFLAEGSEEMASDFLNTIYDELKNGDDSELRTQYRELLASGETEDDAFNRVFGDYVKQVVLDGLAGGLSGIAMSGVAEYATNKRYEKAYADPADTQALLDEARAVNPDSKLLKRAEQRVAEGKGVTGYQARELMGRNEERLAPLKQASAKYGKQSGAMQATYQEGQDVAQYDMSYRVAYEMGKAGTKLSAAQTSEATDYLTDAQTQAAWSAGRDARTRLSDVSEVANGRALLNGQIAEVQTVSAQNGKLMAEVRQGESVQTVALDSLKVDAGTRTLAEGAKQYGSAAGTVFEQYKAGQDVATYLRAADMAAAVGMASPSASSETVLRNLQAGQLGKVLSGEQITAIYKAGQTAGRAQLRKTGMTRLGTGTVTFEQSAKGAKLNAQQKASVQFIRDLAKVTGIDFTIYKSSADSTGRLQGANGAYRDGTVHVDLNAGAAYEGKLESASMLRTVSHELTHYMAEAASTEFSALQDFMVQRLSQWEGHSIQDLVEGKMATAEQAGHPITAQEALEEVVADGCEMMLRDSKAVQQLAEENRTLFEKVRDWMKKFFESLRKAFEGVEAVHPESIHMMENYAGELQKLWDEAFTAAVKNAKEGALGTAHADLKAADTLMNPTQEAAFSLRDNEKFQENAEKKNEALGLVPVNVMRSAAEARSQIAEIMRDPKLRDALNLPDDFSGKTYFADGAYNGTEENTTVCPRSMGAEELLDAVSELLGRPLTVDECINISQFMAGTELRPECEYCYVATDRKAYREFLGRYVEKRDAVLRRMENGMTDAENYRQLLNGRKDTKDMRSRFDLWVKTARSGGQMMQASDLTNVNKLMHDIIDPGIRAQVKDAMRYAQNASWAKKRIGYTAYNGHILNWSKDKITKLNKGFGLRMYSFSDFSPAFILENMQMITDASVRGLKMLAYTKDLDFVRIFAPSGININVSVFGFERNGVVAENALQGASWAEAQKLRAENPNVGITFVATNDTLVNWALAQDWIDVVIPYHLVRTGKQVAQRLGFTNYTAESSDVKQAGWTKGNAKEILPTQHNNDLQTYLRALEENNLRPRFERFLDNQNYMKLVNETRRSALETPAVQPVFDVEAAKKSLIGMIKDGGYFQHIGGSVDRMYEIASDLSQRIYDGAKFSDRDSAGRELSAEQTEAEKRFGTTTDFNEAGFILPDGKMLRFTDDANAGARNYDHRAIGMMYGVDVDLTTNHGFNMESNRHMNRFVEDGGIRFDPGDPDYDMGAGMQLSQSKPLTKAQERTIRDFIAWKQERDAAYVPPDEFAKYMGAQAPLPLTIEFGGGADIAVDARSRDLAAWNVPHLTYEGGQINADRVIADIRHYYETGELRKPSEVARFRYSERVTDKKTLDFLNRQKTVKTYKTMQLVDGKLYPPMAARTNGQYEDYSVLGQWEQATEHPELVRDGKYKLDKGKGQGSISAAYNPYMHSSNLVLNDQFSGAYARPNLVTVECEVPVSELTSGYRADGAKDAVGWHAWHTGTVAGQLRAKTGTERQVLLSRWIKPVRILPDAEVAQMYKRLLSGTDIAVPDNVVTPSLLRELHKAGVSIKESGRVTAQNAQEGVKFSERDSTPNVFNPDGKTIDEQLDDVLNTAESFDGRYLYIGRFTQEFVDLVKPYLEVRNLPIVMNYRDAYLAMANKENGKYRGQGINYHNLGKEGLKQAIEAFAAPDAVMQSKKNGKVELVLDGTDYKGNRFLAIVALDTSTRNVDRFIKAHVVTSVYGRRSIDNYIRKASEDGRLVYDKREEPARGISQVQYKSNINADSSLDANVSQTGSSVKWQERDTVSQEIATLQRDLRQMRAELKRLKGSEGQVDLAAAAQYDAREALRAAKADAQEAREQGILAGQMAQGRQDAKAMSRLEAKLAQERAAGAEGREALRAANRDIRAKDKAIARNDAAIQRLQDRIARTEERLNERIAEQRQRLKDYRENRNETEAARRQRAQIEARCEELTRMLTQNNDKQHIPEPLKQPVKELLEALTPSRFSQSMQERGTETQADARLVRSLEKIRRVAADQAQGKLSDLGYLDLPPEFLDDIDDIFRFVSDGQTEPLYAMNSAQLKELNQVLTVLTTSIKQINRLITAGHFESVRDAAEATALDLDSMRERKLHFGLDSKAGKAEDVLRNFLSWKNTTPYYAFRRFGEGGQDMFRRLADGWDRLAFNSDRIIRFAEDTYTEKEVKAWEKEKHTVTLDSGEVITLSTANAMELYELSKREQAQGHLYGGGVRISGQGIRPVLLTSADVENIAGLLSERQKAVADKLQQYMEIQGSAWGNEVSMERFGYRYFTEPHYYPVVSDSNELIARDTEAQENSMFRLLNLSATKGLREGANNAIVIGSIFDTFANHMSDMAKYNALALPILDTMKWFNYRDTVKNGAGQLLTQNVKQSIEAVYGSDALRYFTTFIKDLNGVSEGGRGEGFANRMISNYKVAAVAANLRVALLQPTAYVRAANVISPKYLTLALKNAPKALWNASGNVFRGSRSGLTGEMLEHSGIALWKSLGFYDTNIGRGVREQIKNAAGIKEKVVEKSMSLAELGDTSTWTVIWSACKLEQKAKGYTGQALLQQTAERFREVVYATQVVDSTMTRSHMMRSKSTFSKLSTAFMSEPTLSYNMLLDAAMGIQEVNRRGGNGWKAQGGKLLRAFTVFASTAAASALVESLFDAFRDDDDEDAITKFINALFGEKLLDGNLGQNLLPIGSLPYLKDAVSILQGYSNERMDTEFISKIVNTAKIWAETYKLETGELDKATKVTSYGSMTTWGKVYKTLDALSSTAGLPLAATTREVTSIWNATIGAISPRMKIKRYESKDQKLEWLYSFAQSGSTADYEKELAGLRRTFPGKKTEEEITESIKDGLRGKIKDHYLDGDLTEQEAQRLIERYTGRDAEEAEDDVNRWHYQRDTGDTDASASMAAAWYGIAEPAGIDREAFAEAWAFHNDVEADKDESGKTVPGSKKQKVVDYIQGLGLNRDQEKALWDALKGNWKDTDTPWE